MVLPIYLYSNGAKRRCGRYNGAKRRCSTIRILDIVSFRQSSLWFCQFIYTATARSAVAADTTARSAVVVRFEFWILFHFDKVHYGSANLSIQQRRFAPLRQIQRRFAPLYYGSNFYVVLFQQSSLWFRHILKPATARSAVVLCFEFRTLCLARRAEGPSCPCHTLCDPRARVYTRSVYTGHTTRVNRALIRANGSVIFFLD